MPLAAIFIALVFSLLTGASVQRLQYEALYRSANAVAADAKLLVNLMESRVLKWQPGSGLLPDLGSPTTPNVFDDEDVPDTLQELYLSLGSPIPLNLSATVYKFKNNAASGQPMQWVVEINLGNYMGTDEARTVALNAAIAIGGGAKANIDRDSSGTVDATEVGFIEVPIPSLYATSEVTPYLPRSGVLPLTGPLAVGSSGLQINGNLQMGYTVLGDTSSPKHTFSTGTTHITGNLTVASGINGGASNFNGNGDVNFNGDGDVNFNREVIHNKNITINEDSLVVENAADIKVAYMTEAGLVYGKTGQFDVLSTPNFEYQP